MPTATLRENCPNAELFLVRIFQHPNAGKYGPEITPYLDTFLAVLKLELSATAAICWLLSSSTVLAKLS